MPFMYLKKIPAKKAQLWSFLPVQPHRVQPSFSVFAWKKSSSCEGKSSTQRKKGGLEWPRSFPPQLIYARGRSPLLSFIWDTNVQKWQLESLKKHSAAWFVAPLQNKLPSVDLPSDEFVLKCLPVTTYIRCDCWGFYLKLSFHCCVFFKLHLHEHILALVMSF